MADKETPPIDGKYMIFIDHIVNTDTGEEYWGEDAAGLFEDPTVLPNMIGRAQAQSPDNSEMVDEKTNLQVVHCRDLGYDIYFSVGVG